MKAIIYCDNYLTEDKERACGWYVVADSAVTNSGKPFYLPDDTGKVTVWISPVIKISRLGKSVESRFADRYFEEIAIAMHFRLSDMWNNLMERRMAVSPAVSFDRSLIISEFVKKPEDIGNLRIFIKKNGEIKNEWSIDNLFYPIDEIVHKFSEMNTIKMGDLILPGLCDIGEIKEGDYVEAEGEGMSHLIVKVK